MLEGGDGRRGARVRAWPRSLACQLVLIPIIVLSLGLLGTVGVALLNGRARVAAETTSSMRLARDLLATALRNLATAGSDQAAFEQLRQDLPMVRHVRFELVPSDAALPRGTRLQIGAAPTRSRPWLAQLLAPPPVEETFRVVVRGKSLGQVRLRSNPADETAEIVWQVALFSAALTGLCLLIAGALLWAVRRALRPVQLLADGFNRLERGEYRPLAPIALTELRRVGQQFNHLAQSLQRLTSDNRLLVDKLLSVQEQERKELAAELHDEIGPTLFGIRAEAACIMRSTPRDTEAHAHARSIAELTEGIQKLNYRMLDRLRPLVLEQMGLAQALRQLLAAWQARHPHIDWSSDIPRDFDEPSEALGLTLYRLVQESATNAIRHAQCSAIEVRVEWTPGEGAEPVRGQSAATRSVSLSVRDNGRGLPANPRYGFGLLGMKERVRQLGGRLTIDSAQPTGVVVQALIPADGRTTLAESARADPVG